ncbi:MAG: hypothetical protein ACN6OP_30545, partial [Pseudomonadales bacterium]
MIEQFTKQPRHHVATTVAVVFHRAGRNLHAGHDEPAGFDRLAVPRDRCLRAQGNAALPDRFRGVLFAICREPVSGG